MANEPKSTGNALNALIEPAIGLQIENFKRMEQDVRRQKTEIQARSAQLEKERADFQTYMAEREKLLSLEQEALKKEFSARERERVAADANSRLQATRMREDAEIRLMEALQKLQEVDEQRKALEVEKLQYDEKNNQRLQLKSVDFVHEVVRDLKKREAAFSRISFWWSTGGGIALAAAAIPAALMIIAGAIWPITDLSWPSLVLYTTKSALFVTVAGIISRYAFLLSKRYLEESLNVSNTIHGVSFGQLYVESYGATAGWDQVKDAFSNWHQRPEHRSATKSDADDFKPEAETSVKQAIDLLTAVSKVKGGS